MQDKFFPLFFNPTNIRGINSHRLLCKHARCYYVFELPHKTVHAFPTKTTLYRHWLLPYRDLSFLLKDPHCLVLQFYLQIPFFLYGRNKGKYLGSTNTSLTLPYPSWIRVHIDTRWTYPNMS